MLTYDVRGEVAATSHAEGLPLLGESSESYPPCLCSYAPHQLTAKASANRLQCRRRATADGLHHKTTWMQQDNPGPLQTFSLIAIAHDR